MPALRSGHPLIASGKLACLRLAAYPPRRYTALGMKADDGKNIAYPHYESHLLQTGAEWEDVCSHGMI